MGDLAEVAQKLSGLSPLPNKDHEAPVTNEAILMELISVRQDIKDMKAVMQSLPRLIDVVKDLQERVSFLEKTVWVLREKDKQRDKKDQMDCKLNLNGLDEKSLLFQNLSTPNSNSTSTSTPLNIPFLPYTYSSHHHAFAPPFSMLNDSHSLGLEGTSGSDLFSPLTNGKMKDGINGFSTNDSIKPKVEDRETRESPDNSVKLDKNNVPAEVTNLLNKIKNKLKDELATIEGKPSTGKLFYFQFFLLF